MSSAQQIPKAPAEGTKQNRRGFLSRVPLVALAWTSLAAATSAAAASALRFLFPNVLYEPPTRFTVGFPEEF